MALYKRIQVGLSSFYFYRVNIMNAPPKKIPEEAEGQVEPGPEKFHQAAPITCELPWLEDNFST